MTFLGRLFKHGTHICHGGIEGKTAIVCLAMIAAFGVAKIAAADEDTCKSIKLGQPLGPGGPFTEEVCVPADKCTPKYAEHAHCSKSQSSCSGHCENFESACYALDDNENKGVTSNAVAGKACKLFIGTGGMKKKVDGVLCTFTTTIAAGGRLGCHCECGQLIAVPIAVSFLRLPAGAIYATASVEPGTTIEIQQPGYAVIATADVVSAKRVNPGDRLDASTTSSIAFDDGKGVIVDTLKRSSVALTATAGLTSLLSRDNPQPLPVQNGSATLFVNSGRPFAVPAIGIGNINKVPDTMHATFLNANGERVGALATFKDLQGIPSNAISVRVLDSNGATLQEGRLVAGALDASPVAKFDKPAYKAGERGQLLISNQENYRRGMEMTRFGGVINLDREPIHLIPISDVRGLPAETPFNTKSLNFQAVHPGEARVAVVLPRILPPKPVGNPGNDEGLKQANASFQAWLEQVGR